jgi:DNA-binding GntR family transcriptional regulator
MALHNDLSAHPTIDEVSSSLRRAILAHRVGPGTKLVEDEVCDVFGVGRTIVRTALQSLAHEGLLTIIRNRGAFVADPGVREAREVFEARALLEPRTAFSAAKRATPEAVAQLKAHIDAEHRALEAGELGQAVYLSGLFHMAIAKLADQNTIAAMISTLVSRSSLIVALYWRRPQALCESHAHNALIDAIASKDAARAEELMKGHLLDLLSNLDLREKPVGDGSLRQAIHGEVGKKFSVPGVNAAQKARL